MEKNKTGKYLKYAIGEIILVVIGILIAVSINNWNERQKKRFFERFDSKLVKEIQECYEDKEFGGYHSTFPDLTGLIISYHQNGKYDLFLKGVWNQGHKVKIKK